MRRYKVDHALIRKLLSQGLTREQIITRTGLPPSTVSYALKKIRDEKIPLER